MCTLQQSAYQKTAVACHASISRGSPCLISLLYTINNCHCLIFLFSGTWLSCAQEWIVHGIKKLHYSFFFLFYIESRDTELSVTGKPRDFVLIFQVEPSSRASGLWHHRLFFSWTLWPLTWWKALNSPSSSVPRPSVHLHPLTGPLPSF